MTRQRIAAIAAIVAIVLVAGAFFAGYLPEHRQRMDAEQQAASLREQLTAAEARVRLAQLLGQTLAVRDAVARLNYGQAQDLSSALFDSVRAEAAATPVDAFRSALTGVLARRDDLTASLTRGDPVSIDAVREIEQQMRQALGYPLPEQRP